MWPTLKDEDDIPHRPHLQGGRRPMAATGSRYTLVGFSAELDWRPLRFVQPIPSHWVCDACGLIRPLAAHLPCQHVLCASCYEQSDWCDARVCPLDGNRCLDENVDLQEIAIATVLRNEVTCWNDHAGCEAVMAASDIGEHFRTECCHHSTSCPRCSAPVLCADVHAHLTWECSTAVLSSSPSDQRGSGTNNEEAPFTAFIGMLDDCTAHIKSKLEHILDNRKAQSRRLSDFCRSIEALKEGKIAAVDKTTRQSRDYFVHSAGVPAIAPEQETGESLGELRDSLTLVSRRINKLEEALLKKLKWGSSCIRDDIARNTTKIAMMHSELRESNLEALTSLEVVTAQTSIKRALYRFAVEGISDLLAKAARYGSAYFLSERVYLRGYFMSTGVRLVKYTHNVRLYACIQLTRGEMDDSLEWPLQMTLKFSAIHPDTGVEWEHNFMLPAFGTVSGLEKSQNEPEIRTLTASFLLDELQRDGYVKEDRLLLKYQLM